jgi:chromosome segregation ATPase
MINLDEIEGRARRATPGPFHFWDFCVSSRTGWVATADTCDTAEFFATARSDVPALIARVRELETQCKTLDISASGFEADWKTACAQRDEARAELEALAKVRAPSSCECGDDDACRFVRERDEARAAWEACAMNLADIESDRDEHLEKRGIYAAECVSLRSRLVDAQRERDEARKIANDAVAQVSRLESLCFEREQAAAEVERLRLVCTQLQRDRNELAATLAFVRDEYTDTLNMAEDAIAMRGRLALVDGLRALLAETQAELATVIAMRGNQ